MPLYALGDAEPDIHPDAYVHPDAVVIGNVTIGAESTVWPTAVLRGDDGWIEVGARTSIQDGSIIHTTAVRPTIIGAEVTVGHNVHIEAATIGDRALISSGSVVLNGSTVGAGAIVGAGAVVAPNAEIPPRTMALGVPARVREGYEVPEEAYAYAVTSYVERGKRFRTELEEAGLMAGKPLAEIVEAGWAQALAPVAQRIADMGDFLRAEVAAGRRYLPAGANVLRAFTQPFDGVRVLIVGQDPYPTPGHAVGLSFSVSSTTRPVPRSLANIFREYTDDLGHPTPSTGDLTPWTEQGVLLLNRVLTVAPGEPGSHRDKGWEAVTEQAIRALVARDGEPLVAILWGRDARNLAPLLGDVPLIESAHPSPMSADRGFFGSRPFSRANALLEELGGDAVDWKLP